MLAGRNRASIARNHTKQRRRVMDVFHSLIIHSSTELEMKFCATVVPCTRHIRIVSRYLVSHSIYNRFLFVENRSGFHSVSDRALSYTMSSICLWHVALGEYFLSKFILLYNCIFKILPNTLTILLNITIVDLDQHPKFNLNEIYYI